VTTYGRGDADEDKLELLREISVHNASARDINPVRYLMMNSAVAPYLGGHGLLYRPRIAGLRDEHERLSFNEAMLVVNSGEWPLFITLARECPFHARPRGHAAVLDLSCALGGSPVAGVVRRLHAAMFNTTPHTYNLVNTPDTLGIVSCGHAGMVLSDCAGIELRDISVSMMSRFLKEHIRFSSLDLLDRRDVPHEDDGQHSIPVLAPASGCDDAAAFVGVLSANELLTKVSEIERITQVADEEGYAALRKTYAAIICCRRSETETDEPENWRTQFAPLDEDDEGHPMPEGAAGTATATDPAKPHHFVVVWRYGPTPVVAKVLRRENLTPFAQGRAPMPERSIPRGFPSARGAPRWRAPASSPDRTSDAEAWAPEDAAENDGSYSYF
jgi:hypothetical protein